jgi:hypothetical protein
MGKVFFSLQGSYEGLRVRRLKRAGRLVLDQVANDGPLYWFVTVRGFDERRDRSLLARTGSRWGNGTFRFTTLQEAEAKFGELLAFPEYMQEAAEAENLTIRRRKLAQQYAHSGRAALERFRNQIKASAGLSALPWRSTENSFSGLRRLKTGLVAATERLGKKNDRRITTK